MNVRRMIQLIGCLLIGWAGLGIAGIGHAPCRVTDIAHGAIVGAAVVVIIFMSFLKIDPHRCE